MVEDLFGDSGSRKHVISRMVHHFVTALEYIKYEQFVEPLIKFRAEMKAPQRRFLDALKAVITKCVIKSPRVQHLEFKGQGMVVAVFEAIQSDPVRLLPNDALARFEKSSGDLRTICDFVAGMTDSYLLKTYERLFAPRMGSVFDKL
jgi:dGTPase